MKMIGMEIHLWILGLSSPMMDLVTAKKIVFPRTPLNILQNMSFTKMRNLKVSRMITIHKNFPVCDKNRVQQREVAQVELSES